MRVMVLGAAAGGGFPQWNCNCPNCAGVRQGSLRAKPRTQSSIFIRPDAAADGVLFNASPDIREQIAQNDVLQPRTGGALRNSAISASRAMRVDPCGFGTLVLARCVTRCSTSSRWARRFR